MGCHTTWSICDGAALLLLLFLLLPWLTRFVVESTEIDLRCRTGVSGCKM